MAAQSLSKITRRLSSSTTGANTSPSFVFFTPPFSAKFGQKAPEQLKGWSASSGNVFSPRDQHEVRLKSPRARLFKNALRADAPTGIDNYLTKTVRNAKECAQYQPSIDAPIRDIDVGSAARRPINSSKRDGTHSLIESSSSSTRNNNYVRHTLGSLAKNSESEDTCGISDPRPSPCKKQLQAYRHYLPSSRMRSQSSVSSPYSATTTCSPTTFARYSVQISKITLTPVKTLFDSSIQRNVGDDNGGSDDEPTLSPNEDVVYFDTPFREELVKKGLDGLDFKPRVLGRGGFGVVVSAFYGGKAVAVKMITKNNRRRRSIEISIENEENALNLVRHPNLVQTFGIYELGQDHSVVVMEFAGSVHLGSILENPAEVITSQRRLNLVCQIADALRWCHIHEILHLDVKPANVMVSNNDLCKLGDFGCSRRLSEVTSIKDDGGESQLLGGTIAYRAPELLQGYRPTFKADIYSLGITMWQILSREMPYKGLDPHVIIYKVVSCDTRPSVPSRTPDYDDATDIYAELYTQLWCRRQNERPNIDQVIQRLRSLQSNIRISS